MISDRTRIPNVNTAEKMPTPASLNTTAACAPAPVAPTVCAIVLSERIAARGRSISARNLLSFLESCGCSSSAASTKDGVIDNRTASRIEQRNDTPIANSTKIISKVITVSFAFSIQHSTNYSTLSLAPRTAWPESVNPPQMRNFREQLCEAEIQNAVIAGVALRCRKAALPQVTELRDS